MFTNRNLLNMNCKNKIIIVTGGAHGIGKALCERFAAEGADKIIVADVDFENAAKVAASIGGEAVKLDVSDEAEVKSCIEKVLAEHGRVDLVCSNAGIGGKPGALEVANEDWQKIWEVNVMAHLYLSRAVFPSMIERGKGYFLLTVSAAGLLTHFEAAPYSVSKHAALAFGEWLSIAYRDAGIRVSCLCPQGVKTQMLNGDIGGQGTILMETAIEPEVVAEAVINGLESEKFLILPHPEVGQYFINKAENYERWLHSLRKMRKSLLATKSNISDL